MSRATVGWGATRGWWGGVALYGVVAMAGVVLTADLVGVDVAARWGLVTVAVGAVVLAYVRRNLSRNHPPGRPRDRFRRLGIPNVVTVVRGACFAALAGFVVAPPAPDVRWAPAAFYGIGVMLDLADGGLARYVGRTTVLGRKLDRAVDTLGFLVAPLVAVAWGQLPVYYLSLGLARYAFKAACWQRRYRGYAVGELPPSRLRRWLAAGQMGFLTVSLSPVLSSEWGFALAPFALAPSLGFFLRDYLVVTGRL